MNRFTVIVILLTSSALFSYNEKALPNFGGNFNLPSNSLEAAFGHRFYGAVNNDPWNTLLGLGVGANARIDVLYTLFYGIHADAGFTSNGQEFELGAGYSYMPDWLPLGGQAALQFSTDRNYDAGKNDFIRQADLFPQLLLQSKPVFNRIVLTATSGYDNNENKIGIGAGTEIILLDNISIFGEVSPLRTKPSEETPYAKVPFNFGIRAITFGHQFLLFLGNATEIGPRKFLYGAGNTDLKIGFEIKRLFNFSD